MLKVKLTACTCFFCWQKIEGRNHKQNDLICGTWYVSTAVKENTLFLLTAALRFPSLLLARTLACYDEPWRRRAQEEGLRRPGQVDGDVEVAVRPSPSRLLLAVLFSRCLIAAVVARYDLNTALGM